MKVIHHRRQIIQFSILFYLIGMGLCFVGKRKFSSFISQYIPDNIGFIKLIETNQIIGEHYGLHRYTIGQRITPINKQYQSSKPLFIARKDPIENIIYAVNHFMIILFNLV